MCCQRQLHFPACEESRGIVDKVLNCDWGDPGSHPALAMVNTLGNSGKKRIKLTGNKGNKTNK